MDTTGSVIYTDNNLLRATPPTDEHRFTRRIRREPQLLMQRYLGDLSRFCGRGAFQPSRDTGANVVVDQTSLTMVRGQEAGRRHAWEPLARRGPAIKAS